MARAARSRNRMGSEAAEKIINKYGADVLRLWIASIDFTEDVRLSDTILDRLIEAYRKLRNTFRYALGNLHDFDPAEGRGAGRATCSKSTAGFWRARKI